MKYIYTITLIAILSLYSCQTRKDKETLPKDIKEQNIDSTIVSKIQSDSLFTYAPAILQNKKIITDDYLYTALTS